MRRIVQFILGLGAAALNVESDWVRYGLPAILLTAIFFFAMRLEAPKVALPLLRPPMGARKLAPPAATSFSVPPFTSGDRPKMPSNGTAQGMAMTPPSSSFRAAQPRGLTAVGALSREQVEGRRALCSAVQYALTRVKRKHWKTKAMEIATESYRGQGGPQAAGGAISSALTDYAGGKWDEGQCAAVGGSPLSKGSIAEVMR